VEKNVLKYVISLNIIFFFEFTSLKGVRQTMEDADVVLDDATTTVPTLSSITEQYFHNNILLSSLK